MTEEELAQKAVAFAKDMCKGRRKGDVQTALRKAIAAISEARTVYSQELADEVIARMEAGETIRGMGKDPHMPTPECLVRWRRDNPAFDQRYARARVQQMHAWADEITSLADDCETDYGKIEVRLDDPALERTEKDGVVTFRYTRKHVTRAQLMIDTRKWLMSRFDPATFADRRTVDVAVTYEDKDDGELIAELREAAQKAGISAQDVLEWLGSGVDDNDEGLAVH